MSEVADKEQESQIEPEFLVTLKPHDNGGGGIVEIRGVNQYESHEDIPRWLRACLLDVTVEIRLLERTSGV